MALSADGPFPSSLQPLFQGDSMCEISVFIHIETLIITITNIFALSPLLWKKDWGELRNSALACICFALYFRTYLAFACLQDFKDWFLFTLFSDRNACLKSLTHYRWCMGNHQFISSHKPFLTLKEGLIQNMLRVVRRA